MKKIISICLTIMFIVMMIPCNNIQAFQPQTKKLVIMLQTLIMKLLNCHIQK